MKKLAEVSIGCLLVAACLVGLFSSRSGDFGNAEVGRTTDGEFDIPPSLVWRMYQAHNAARDRRLNGGQPLDVEELFGLMGCGITNAEAIAAQPRGEMRFCDDCLTDDKRRELWPFDVESFESALEAKMVRDEEGLFRKKAGSDGSAAAGDEGLVASNPTIRWVNNEIEQWAVARLDEKYTRLDDAALRKAAGNDAFPEGWLVWMLADKGVAREFFVIARGDGAWNPRYYIDLICDDNGMSIIASFDSFPNRREAAAMRMFGDDIAAVHNLAVLEWRHRNFRLGMDPQRIKRWLEEARRLNVPTAEANLKVLLDHIPESAMSEASQTKATGG